MTRVLRWLRSTRFAHRVVDVLLDVPEPPPLPEPNQRLVDLIDATRARIEPYREAVVRADWTDAQRRQWYDIEGCAQRLCESAKGCVYYITLNLPVYLDTLRGFAAFSWVHDKASLRRIGDSVLVLCSDINDLIDAAGDRRLVGSGDPGHFIDAARIQHVYGPVEVRRWGMPSTWRVEFFTTKVEDLEADPPMTYCAIAYSFDYPDRESAARDAERVRAFVAHGLPGAQAIAAERQRQIDTEGWTPEHDDAHAHGELLLAAIAYTVEGVPSDTEWTINDMEFDHDRPGVMPDWWPWSPDAWKPTEDARGNLVKAGALIAAELDRLARAGAREFMVEFNHYRQRKIDLSCPYCTVRAPAKPPEGAHFHDLRTNWGD